jgi:hypothetical protein
MFSSEMKVLRAGPAPLTLVSLGRWASIAAAAGDSPTVQYSPANHCSNGEFVMRVPRVGDLFTVRKPFPSLPVGTRVVCVYVDRNAKGEIRFVRVISLNSEGRLVEDSFAGAGTDMSMSNWESDLEYFDHDSSLDDYHFTGLDQVARDFRSGAFSHALGPWQR